MDRPILIILLIVIFGPGLLYMSSEGLFDEPLAWLAFVGLGGGIAVVWAGLQSEDKSLQKMLSWIGGSLMLAGMIASGLIPEY